MKTIVVGEPNHLLRIDEMFAFISKDENGNEGVCAFKSPMGWMPMVGADQKRADQLMAVAKDLVAETGKEIIFCKFSSRTEIQRILPQSKTN